MDSDEECPPDLVPAEDLMGSPAVGGPRSSTVARDCRTTNSPTKPAVEPIAAVPVTIVTGFLGAGKTTLLNYILTQNHGRRIAVIENEVGDSMDIEALIAKANPACVFFLDDFKDGADGSMLADNLFELKNGCICCSVKDDLVTTLETLLQRRNKFDYIIIETTGLANPGPVASVFWLDDALESVLRLDGIITLVDAKNIRRQLQRGSDEGGVDRGNGKEQPARGKTPPNEAAIQVAYADRVLINKTDLVSKEVLDDIVTQIRTINTVAAVRCTRRSAVDLSWVLDTKCFSPELALEVDQGLAPTESLARGQDVGQETDGTMLKTPVMPSLGESGARVEGTPVIKGSNEGSTHNHGDEPHGHSHSDDYAQCAATSEEGPRGTPCSVHDPAVTTCAVDILGSMELRRLERWLGELLWDPPPGGTEVYRVKGVVSAEGSDERFVVQGVGDIFEVAPAGAIGSAWKEDETRHCKVVFIGRYLFKDKLERGLRSCMIE